MKSDVKDLLNIPKHLYRADADGKKAKKKEGKPQTEGAHKDILKISKGLFPLKTHRTLSIGKSPADSTKVEWVWTQVNFGTSHSELKPELYFWTQKLNKDKAYHFSKYDLALILPDFSDEEYDEHLANLDPKWTKDETFYFWDLLKRYEMRFFVVYDRYDTSKYPRSLDELKHKFYSVCRKLAQLRGETKSPYFSYSFDYEHEKLRKYQLEKYILRGKDKHDKEKELIEDLKKIEAQIKKKEKEHHNLKRMMEFGNENTEIEQIENIIEHSETKQHSIFENTARCTYLRGSIMHGPLPNLSTKLNKKIDDLMLEMNIPPKPMPTARLHSRFDRLRKSILKMFSLQIHLKNIEQDRDRLQENFDSLKITTEKQNEQLGKRVPKVSGSVAGSNAPEGDKVQKKKKSN